MRISKLMMPAVTLAGARALAGCGGGSSTTTTTAACPAGETRVGGVCTPTTDDSAAQLAAVRTASTALATAMAALTPAPTQAEVDTAKQEIADLKAAIAAADDVAAADLADYSTEVAEAEALVPAFQLIVTNTATERTNAANAAKLAMAEQLFVAIGDVGDSAARGTYADADEGDKYQMMVELEGNLFTEDYGTPDEDANGAYALASDADEASATLDWALAASPKFGTAGGPAANLKDHVYNESFGGTYDGVEGTYICTTRASGCTSGVEVDAGDTVTVLSAGWTFTPDDAKARIKGNVARYGWWLDRTGGVVSDVELRHGAIADTGLLRSTSVDAHIGSAAYEGNALGQYAFRLTGDHGRFKADANLTANFDAASTAGGAIDGTSISGTLNEFKVGADEESRDWTVTLRTSGSVADTAIVAQRVVTTQPLPFTGKTVWDLNGPDKAGGRPTLEGTTGDWYADLYSLQASTESGTTAAGLPGVVSGWFDAEHDDALMRGSFGAK